MIDDVLALDKIARNLHRRRFENGALRLDKAKLGFRLDDDGNPATCSLQGLELVLGSRLFDAWSNVKAQIMHLQNLPSITFEAGCIAFMQGRIGFLQITSTSPFLSFS